MKLSDVKVGMRVACYNTDGYLTGFGEVGLVDPDGLVQVDKVNYYYAAQLRKVKPKKSVSFETKVHGRYEQGEPNSGYIGVVKSNLVPFIGKRVHVTVKEIK